MPADAVVTGAPPLRLGVLGAADIARRRMLPAVAAEPGVELVAVAGRNPGRARRCTDVFGGEPMVGYRTLLERPDIDAVYVPLPAALHARWVEAALSAGKHVLAEKPLATRAADAHRLVALAADRALVLAENYMFTLHPQHLAVAKLIGDGLIGAVRGMRAAFTIPPLPAGDIRYRPEVGGGALDDVGGYPLRASTLLLGEPLEVLGASLRVDTGRGVDLSGAALLATPAGVVSHVTFGLEHAYRAEYEVWGTTGSIRLERAYATPADHGPVLHIRTGTDVTTRRLEPDDQFRRVVRAFAAAVRDGAPSGLQGDDILRQADLVHQVRTMARRTEITGP